MSEGSNTNLKVFPITLGTMTYGNPVGFDEAVEEAISLEGRRFSPMLTARLRDKRVAALIWEAFETGRREAYRRMYEREEK